MPLPVGLRSISPDTGSDNQRITITYEENTDPAEREAILTLSATELGATERVEITLTQAGALPAVVGLPTLAGNLRFYPNPASQTLYIEGVTQETNLLIRTLSGKTLLRATLHQNQAIDLTALPQGTYLLTLQSSQESGQESGQEQRTERLIIGL